MAGLSVGLSACGQLDTTVITPYQQQLQIPTKFYQACFQDQMQYAGVAYTAINQVNPNNVIVKFVDKVESVPSHQGMTPMGATFSQVNNQILLTARTLTSKSGAICAHFAHEFTYSLGKPIEIHISTALQNNQCLYRYVYQHEFKHVLNVDAAVQSSLNQYRESAVQAENPLLFFANVEDYERYKADYTKKVNDKAKKWLDLTMHQIQQADAELDKIESYKRIQDIACP